MKNYYPCLFLIMSGFCFGQFDLQRNWATYFAGGYNVTSNTEIDSDGNLIILANVLNQLESNSFYDAFTTPGAQQPNISTPNSAPTSEVLLAKFSPAGYPIWVTYFGGSGVDIGRDLTIDNQNNIIIVGGTNSTSGIATPGAINLILNDPTVGGSFMTKYNTNGNIIWSTYLQSKACAVTHDSNNNIYLFGKTLETTNIANSSAYINSFANTAVSLTNAYSGFICKYDSQGNRINGTYTGHVPLGEPNIINQGRVAYGVRCGIAIDGANNVVIFHEDNGVSQNFYSSPGAHQLNSLSIEGAVISKFNNSLTSRIWSTYFGGEVRDSIESLILDNNDIYIAGTAQSTTNIATPTSFQPNKSGVQDGYVVKFNSNGNRVWGTYFGSIGHDFIYKISISGNNIILCGTTSSANFATAGAYLTQFNNTSSNSYASFFASINKNTSLRNWCSYYGGNRGTYLTSLSQINSSLYLFGNTRATTDISTPQSFRDYYLPGVVAPTVVGAVDTNLFIVKFDTALSTNSFDTTSLRLSPNPNRGSFSLQGNINNQDNLNLTIYDNLGRAVAINKINVLDNNINQTFNLENVLTTGVYFAKLTNENQVLETFKVLIR